MLTKEQKWCNIILRTKQGGLKMNKLFDKDGNFKDETFYQDNSFESIVRELGVELDEYGAVESVNWGFINSMKDEKYEVYSDFLMYYFAIIVSKNSNQSLYHVLDKWMWTI